MALRGLAGALVGSTLALIFFASSAEAKSKYQRLLDTIERDDAYKVRMQAIRVLSRRIEKSKTPPPQDVIDALGSAANVDESYLVRGMAVVALGRFGDPRAKPYLENAKGDSESFVRKQAEKALSMFPDAPPAAGPKSLVLGFVEKPGETTPATLRDALVAYLREGFAKAVGDQYAIDDGDGRTGYHLNSSIAERSVKPEGEEQRITIKISLTIATWPEKNLRQVLSAKASAKTTTKNASAIERLEKTLLRAAVDRVVKDSLAQIRGG